MKDNNNIVSLEIQTEVIDEKKNLLSPITPRESRT